MNDKQQVVDRLLDNKIEIFDLEIVEDNYSGDRLRNSYYENKVWTGTALYHGREFKFKFTNMKTEDNGSDVPEITSKKPNDMTQDEWDNTVDLLHEFLEEDYRGNQKGWEDDVL